MKLAKTALVIALASVGTMAAAESQVTLYGTIDGAVVVNKAKGGDATVSLEDGKDLGNGYSVGFLLENGFAMDSGSAGEEGKAFSKQATLSLSGNFGELAFGRMGGLASYEGSY